MLHRVYTEADGTIIAFHRLDQAVSVDEYARDGKEVRVFDMPYRDMPQHAYDKNTGVLIRARLSRSFMDSYVKPDSE